MIICIIPQPAVCVMILVTILYGQYAVVLVLHHAVVVLEDAWYVCKFQQLVVIDCYICIYDKLQCNDPTYVGDGRVCGLDSDNDGFPDDEV